MPVPRISTCPSTRAFGTVSCILFRQRRSVDLPQPEGPMIAVTSCCAIDAEMFRMAPRSPNQADRFSVRMHVFCAPSMADTIRRRVGVATTGSGLTVASSVDWSTEARPGDETSSETDCQDHGNEDECAGPRLRVPLIVGTDG